jgi:dihydroxy-acid dehydratase
MSGTAFGTVILHVTPEAAVGGPLALVRTGDLIRLDTARRRLDLLIGETEWQARREQLSGSPAPVAARGYHRLFLEQVLQADRGCDFLFLTSPIRCWV